MEVSVEESKTGQIPYHGNFLSKSSRPNMSLICTGKLKETVPEFEAKELIYG